MEQILCPQCNTLNTPTNSFCTNCAKLLKVAPFTISVGKQISLYLMSFLLPPFGIIPGIRYLRKNEAQAKKIGMILILLTAISTVIQISLAVVLLKELNNIIAGQMRGSETIPSGL